jgi:hypothetical protein
MKNTILKFLKHDRSYIGAMKIYNEHGQRLSLKRHFNNQHESELSEILFDELREMAELSQNEYQAIIDIPVKEEETSHEIQPVTSVIPIIKKEKKVKEGQPPKKVVVAKDLKKEPVKKKVTVKKVISAKQEISIPEEAKK